MKTANRFSWQTENWQQWQAQQSRLAHAYLLTGSPGIGVSDFIATMAKMVLCQNESSSHGACSACKQCHLFEQGLHPDFFQVELLEDKKEINIDQIRALNKKLFETSHQGGYKVAVIEQTERLNVNAFNALLKTIEEPPPNTLIILSSYQESRLPATIHSRCRKLRFAKPDLETAKAWLATQLPQVDTALIKRALKFNWGAPIDALNWIEEKQFQTEAAWQQSLSELTSGKKTVTQVVEIWKKFTDPTVIFEYFYLWSVNRIRAALYQEKLSFDAEWMHFQQMAMQAKLTWRRNANKDLVLEALCMAWLKLQTAEGTQTRQDCSVFKPQLVRGKL